MSEFDWLDDGPILETDYQLSDPLKLDRKEVRRNFVKKLREETLLEVLERLPGPEESVHIVSNGAFDYWSFVPACQRLIGKPVTLYGSTWTMSRNCIVELMECFDTGLFTQISLLTGADFKHRETAVYATLVGGLLERGQRYLCFQNHAKVFLMTDGTTYLVGEGSANWTGNPRLEQTTLTNSKRLYDFHQEWMEEVFTNAKRIKRWKSRHDQKQQAVVSDF